MHFLPPLGSSRWFNGFCTTLLVLMIVHSISAKAVKPPGQARRREADGFKANSDNRTVIFRPLLKRQSQSAESPQRPREPGLVGKTPENPAEGFERFS